MWGAPLLALLFGAGCAKEADNGFCATHGPDHWQHRDEVAGLTVRYGADGALEGRLSLPAEDAGPAAAGVLASAEEVFTTDANCVAEEQSVTREGGRLLGEYRLRCTGEAPLAALSVPLFDQLPELEELEVTMTTPAVTKHFLVHRRCERALFNIAREAREERGERGP